MRTHDEFRDDLPLYAVGALSREETDELKRHLSECPACRQELAGLDEAAVQIALAVEPLAPHDDARARLLAGIEVSTLLVAPAQVAKRPVKPRSPPWSAWFWAPAFAAAMLVMALAALWRDNRNLARMNEDLAARLQAGAATAQEALQVMDTLSAVDAMRVTLVAAGARVQPEAKTVYSAQHRSLVLLASNLTALPAQKIYELWLLPSDGTAPVPAGTFKPDARGSATLVFSQFAGTVPAKGFAVTIENAPGSSVPTMPIVLSGTA